MIFGGTSKNCPDAGQAAEALAQAYLMVRRGAAEAANAADGQFLEVPKGFTLIEAVLTIVIISVGLFSMMLLFDNITRGAMEGDMNVTATYLVRERLERIAFDKVYRGYSNVTMAAYPASENVLVGGNNYIRELIIYEVAKNDLLTAQLDSGFKRVDVTVRWGTAANQRIMETTLLTNY